MRHPLLTPALSALLALAIHPVAHAQDDTAALPLWEYGVFAGGLSSPAYPASNQQVQRGLVLPFLVYRGTVLRADRNGVGARMLQTERVELDVGFSGALPASSNDVALRQGMPDLGTLLEFGPRAKVRLAQPAPGQRLSLELPLRAVLEFNGGVRQVGYAMEPKLAYEWGMSQDWRLKGALSAVLGDQSLNQYFFGVSQAYATPNRPAFDAQPGLIATRLTLDGSTHLTPDLNLFAYARYDLHQGSANQGSPLFAQDHGSTVGLGLSWTLGRSQARAQTSP